MKKLSYIILLIFILLIILPILILKSCKSPSTIINSEKDKDITQINVYINNLDKVIAMELDEYIKGVVAAEMPASFELEALKAQAVAARTYTLSRVIKPQDNLREEHKDADICSNYAHCQAWISKEQLLEEWGFFSYCKYWNKISEAVDGTRGIVIKYHGELINPLFHSTSGGKTENSEDVFLTSLPYLRSVVSLGEEASPKYNSKIIIKFKDFKNKLLEAAPDLILGMKDITNIKLVEQTEGGRVKSIQIGNKLFTGKEIRNIFLLNSTNFKISSEGDIVIFNTIGYGHGVGMSQFGANHLAKTGKDYIEILKHYYKEVDIANINS